VRKIAVASVALALTVTAAGGYALGASRRTATVVRQPLAVSPDPVGAAGRTIGLARVLIPPGVKLAPHYHEGTQVAYVQSGVLTYSVHRGSAELMRGPAAPSPRLVRRIRAGETVRIHAGEWLIEQPDDVHSAANRGHKTIVIYQATLLRTGAPPSNPAP